MFDAIDEVLKTIKDFFAANDYARLALDAYLSLLIISFFVWIALKFKKAFKLTVVGIALGLIWIVSDFVNLQIAKLLSGVVLASYLILVIVIIAPEIRRYMEVHKLSDDSKKTISFSATQQSREAIISAVFNLSSQKVGALITIEQHMSLEQYSERAISLNSDITKELLEQIFIKDSPLHDGGVIIRNNKIVCAAAYYSLSQDNESLSDKTIGSRHRAALGVSELTDSLTIIVSEETGTVHVAVGGIMKVMRNENELYEYINYVLKD